ncbi:amidase [Frankia sp. R43]|uniref:amidase n=1 Tax=Frankia sp. R43 TaxID=269536 RepID=UPI00128EF927|nr:amidase [Frankia sp. R43]
MSGPERPVTIPARVLGERAMRRLAENATPGSLQETARLLRAGELSPRQVLDDCHRRATRANAALNCYVTIGAEQALEQALEQSLSRFRTSAPDERPLLWGIPTSVKDLTPTAGMRTTFASRAFAEHVPPHDAPVVGRMKAAGAAVFAKTSTSEFGILPVTEPELNGVCRNPWDHTLSAGGSSGGAAASVAAGVTAVAHGSDGAGSLRIPASCCGVFAVMPGPGRLPVTPRPALGAGAQDGVVSRTVADAIYWLTALGALDLDEVALAVSEDPWPADDHRIVLTNVPPVDCEVDPVCTAAAVAAANLLAGAGCRVEEAAPDWSADAVLDDLMLVRSTVPVAYGDPRPEMLDATTRAGLELAGRTSALDLHRAIARLGAYTQRASRVLAEGDVLLTPTVARPSVPHGWVTAPAHPADVFRRAAHFAPFAAFANLAGLCAVSLPLGAPGAPGASGVPGALGAAASVPVGVQLMARPRDLAGLLGLALRLERLAPWADRVPPVWVG